MKRILLSLITVGAVAGTAIIGSGAFFSDTETSVDNQFVAGDIDLKIDNESYAIDHNIPNFPNPVGALVFSGITSWDLTDLIAEKFFDFIDLKPGDFGEDTISIHVGSNDAWMCAAAQITEDLDNDIVEPEDEVFGANDDNDDGTPDGDLDSALQFTFWVDDGDNVLESCGGDPVPNCVDETQSIFLGGTLADMGQAGQIRLADSTGSILGGGPIPGGPDEAPDFFIGKAWCYGQLTADPLEQDGGDLGRSPDVDGTGISCDGSGVGNIGQTDSVVGDLQFYAVQSRNNTDFICDRDWQPQWPNQG